MPKEQETKESRAFDHEGLVLPKKLPNPNVDSREKKDLHKEMLWKMKFGGDDPKNCELSKAYANYANRQRLKAIEVEQSNRMTFEKLLEEQKQRLHSVGGKSGGGATAGGTTGPPPSSDSYLESELTLAQLDDTLGVINNNNNNNSTSNGNSNSNQTVPNKDEFLRVFSKVRAKQSDGTNVAEAVVKPLH